MFCRKCGRKLNQDQLICPDCHNPVPETEICTGFWDLLQTQKLNQRTPESTQQIPIQQGNGKSENPEKRIEDSTDRSQVRISPEITEVRTVIQPKVRTKKVPDRKVRRHYRRIIFALILLLILSAAINIFMLFRGLRSDQQGVSEDQPLQTEVTDPGQDDNQNSQIAPPETEIIPENDLQPESGLENQENQSFNPNQYESSEQAQESEEGLYGNSESGSLSTDDVKVNHPDSQIKGARFEKTDQSEKAYMDPALQLIQLQ